MTPHAVSLCRDAAGVAERNGEVNRSGWATVGLAGAGAKHRPSSPRPTVAYCGRRCVAPVREAAVPGTGPRKELPMTSSPPPDHHRRPRRAADGRHAADQPRWLADRLRPHHHARLGDGEPLPLRALARPDRRQRPTPPPHLPRRAAWDVDCTAEGAENAETKGEEGWEMPPRTPRTPRGISDRRRRPQRRGDAAGDAETADPER